MIADTTIREQGYIYFLTEAPELLQLIEQELLNLSEDRSTARVHSLMRATHTIKGSAANVGLEVIKTVAHSLEDVLKALYNPDLVIDAPLQTLLMQGYECLRLPLIAELMGGSVNEDEVLDRAAAVFAQLQAKLGDYLSDRTPIPSSVELGFDIVQSLFQTGVEQRLESIAAAIEAESELSQNPPPLNPPGETKIYNCLRSQAEVFVGLAESLNLPGFKAIAETTLAALDAQPTEALKIAEIALSNFQQAREAVLAGDRTRGGEPFVALQQLTNVATELSPEFIDTSPLTNELEQFSKFLTSGSGVTSADRCYSQKPLEPKVADFYLKTIRHIWGWFQHEVGIPQENLCLALLVPDPKNQTEAQKTALEQRENALDSLPNWLSQFFNFLTDTQDSQSLRLYRQGCILVTLLAIAKFRYLQNSLAQIDGGDIPTIQTLDRRIRKIANTYKKCRPVTESEKQWLEHPKLQKLIAQDDSNILLETVWGGETFSESSLETTNNEQVVIEDDSIEESSLSQVNVTQVGKSTNGEFTGSNRLVAEKNLKPDTETVEATAQNLKSKTQNSLPHPSVRVDLERLEQLNHLAGEMLINQNRQILQDEQLKATVQQLLKQLQQHQKNLSQLRDRSWVNPKSRVLPDSEETSEHQHPKLQNLKSLDFDSLELEQFTELNLLLHSALEETLQLEETTELIDLFVKQAGITLEKQQRLLFSMRDELVEVRMLPMGDVLNRFTQTVQKLGTMYSKAVELKLSGTQVLVDKVIAEKLYDPLLQLVRNAFDHGIESPEIRRQCGKPEQGLIEICTYRQGTQTTIEVRDDGKGLDIERIRCRAIELNLLPAEESTDGMLPTQIESQLLELLFEPGFSTAPQLSELSGRGIGLDIVRSQLQALKGSITVQSVPQQGTTFSLQIPCAMTTAKSLIVTAGGITYALLFETIEKFLLPNSDQVKQFAGKVLHWDTEAGECIVMHHLTELMPYPASAQNVGVRIQETSIQNSPNPVILLRRDTELLGLEVEQVLGEQELVIRPLGNAIAAPHYVYGCSVLGDGRLVLVIDGAVLVSGDRQRASDSIMPSTTGSLKPIGSPLLASTVQPQPLLSPSIETALQMQPNVKSPKWILVVDDAVSIRQTLTLTLQKSGYEVLQAQDGLDALEQLRQGAKVDVVICDLEMPRMNGFEFLSNVCQAPGLVKVPVVMLTSRSAEKHRQFALELGATAYFTKPYLEQELLATLAELMS